MWGRKKYVNKDVLIFLDIDGVLNTTHSLNTKYEIRDENVDALGKLQSRLMKGGYSVKVILSSTWRLGFDYDLKKCSLQIQRLISKLEEVNIKVYDKTPVYKEKTRDVEILRYLRWYELKNKEFDYIILDDDISIFDNDTLKEMRFYKVNQHTGLMVKDIDKIIKMLR